MVHWVREAPLGDRRARAGQRESSSRRRLTGARGLPRDLSGVTRAEQRLRRTRHARDGFPSEEGLQGDWNSGVGMAHRDGVRTQRCSRSLDTEAVSRDCASFRG